MSQDSQNLFDDVSNDCEMLQSPQIHPQFMRVKSYSGDDIFINQNKSQSVKYAQKSTKTSKINKTKKMRTGKNAQKTYHLILNNWLKQNNYQSLIKKYKSYFNKRIYFILILSQILKKRNGLIFQKQYEKDAEEIINKKQRQIQKLKEQKENCQYIQHLKRLIEELKFSISACHQFINGNTFQAITIVYKRHQAKISKFKEFQMAIKIFKEEFGIMPYDIC